MTGQNQVLDEAELADLAAEIEAEMKVKGIGPVIVLDPKPSQTR